MLDRRLRCRRDIIPAHEILPLRFTYEPLAELIVPEGTHCLGFRFRDYITMLCILGIAANNTTILVSHIQACVEGSGCVRPFRYRTCKEKSLGRLSRRKREMNWRENRHGLDITNGVQPDDSHDHRTICRPPEDVSKPVPAKPGSSELSRPDILEFIDNHIEQCSQELRVLSLGIHGTYVGN